MSLSLFVVLKKYDLGNDSLQLSLRLAMDLQIHLLASSTPGRRGRKGKGESLKPQTPATLKASLLNKTNLIRFDSICQEGTAKYLTDRLLAPHLTASW